MTETVRQFIELVDEKEAAREANKAYYVDIFTMPREMMLVLRDELRKQYVPTIDEIVGLAPDITEGLSMKEYLDRIADDV